ncbi:LysR family transcriptional regulator [Pokkaliibacter sp. CJK22405]|uniref:LysR family transcriptional regulator n=1 Tax=Pokkaliibacter sp. CJK22405 TaxID=3384615 RepID=UPI0039854FDD
MFNHRQLKAFVLTAELTSFTQAARQVHLTQPALSYLIRKLEEELGVELFARNTRKVILTDAGELFLGHARRILADMENAITDTRNVKQLAQGQLSIAALPSVASALLPQTLAVFCKRFPRVQVRVRDGLAGQVHAWVEKGEVDVGITSLLEENRDLQFDPLQRDDLILLTPPRVVRPNASPWKGLEAMPYIAMTPGSSARHYADLAMAQAQVSFTPAWELSFMSSAIAMVRARLGFALLPASSVDVFNLSDVTRLALNMQAPRAIGLLRRKPVHTSPALEAFVRCSNELVGEGK